MAAQSTARWAPDTVAVVFYLAGDPAEQIPWRDFGTPLIIGGPFVTTAPEEALRRTGASIAVVGQGEAVVVEAIGRALDGWKGMLVGPAVDPSDYPMPDWSLAPLEQYPRFNGRVRGVLTVSRGCPQRCSFCSVWTVAGRKHYRKDRDRIHYELVNLYHAGARYICFLDDNLFINEQAVDDVLGAIADTEDLIPDFKRVRFYMEEGMEVRVAARPGLLRRIAEARFDNIALGLESMNSRRRQECRKPYNERQLEQAVAESEKAGITAKAFYIVGLPGDTIDSVCRDLLEFGRLGLAARPNNLKLYPGTEVTTHYQTAGLIGPDYDWRLSSFWTPDTPELRFEDVRRLKTVLGAIGHAADQFGVALFRDSIEEIEAALARRRYELRRDEDEWSLTGNFYRATPYRHMLELLAMYHGQWPGVRAVMPDTKQIRAERMPVPSDPIQAAFARLLGLSSAALQLPGMEG